MGGNGGKPKPGGAQIIKGKGMGGATQVQPAFASVTSVTPGEFASVTCVSPAEIAVSSEGTSPADGIALGLDGDAQAVIPNAPTTTSCVNLVMTKLLFSRPSACWLQCAAGGSVGLCAQIGVETREELSGEQMEKAEYNPATDNHAGGPEYG
jgi:hypothetical protein